MSQFTESDHPRASDGKFAEKPPAPEAEGVDLAGHFESPKVVQPFEDVEDQYDGEAFDSYEEANEAAQAVADEGYIGVVHAERHYDESEVFDGEVEYTDESYEVRAFASKDEMSAWADKVGLAVQDGRQDGQVLSSVDPYRHPYTGDVETHEAYVRMPSRPAVNRCAQVPTFADEIRTGMKIRAGDRAAEVWSVEPGETDGSIEVETEDQVLTMDRSDTIDVIYDDVMSEDEFDRRFAPQQNAWDELHRFEDVKEMDPRNVWTVTEAGGDQYAAPGFHTVNRLGYLTSETPWDETSASTAAWYVESAESKKMNRAEYEGETS